MRKIFRGSYWKARRLLMNSAISRMMCRKILVRSHDARVNCPVCGCISSCYIVFTFDKEKILKNVCSNCDHIFTNWVQMDPLRCDSIFQYKQENKNIIAQDFLLTRLMHETGGNGIFLDFGIGGNFSHIQRLNKKFNDNEFWGCDMYERIDPFYFRTYCDKNLNSYFDGICSNAVIEHLANTTEAWKYFNKLLKMGGVMLHSFPSQIYEDWFHWTIRIKSHECLFSEKSLKLLCQTTGFTLLKTESFTPCSHPLYFFKKIENCL